MDALLQEDHHAYTGAIAGTKSKYCGKAKQSPTSPLSVSGDKNQFLFTKKIQMNSEDIKKDEKLDSSLSVSDSRWPVVR